MNIRIELILTCLCTICVLLFSVYLTFKLLHFFDFFLPLDFFCLVSIPTHKPLKRMWNAHENAFQAMLSDTKSHLGKYL